MMRLPREAVAILQDWFDANTHHPYLTSDNKAELVAQTGLSGEQVKRWLRDARTKQRRIKGLPVLKQERLPATAVAVLQEWFDANRDHSYPTSDMKMEITAQSGLTNRMARARAKQRAVKKVTRYPAEVVAHLKAWYDNHRDNPKLTKGDKEELIELTGLTKRQISTWVYNKQRRSRNKTDGTSSIKSSAAKTDVQIHHKRLLDEAKRVVEQWLTANKAKPYPSCTVLRQWQEEYGVTRDRVAQWLHSNVKLPDCQATIAKLSWVPSGFDSHDSHDNGKDMNIHEDRLDIGTTQTFDDNGKSDISNGEAASSQDEDGSHSTALNVDAPLLSARAHSDSGVAECDSEQGHEPTELRRGQTSDGDIDEPHDYNDHDDDHKYFLMSDSDDDGLPPPSPMQAAALVPASNTPSAITTASTTRSTIMETATPPEHSASAMANKQRRTAKRQSTSKTTQPAKRSLKLQSEVEATSAISSAPANGKHSTSDGLVQPTSPDNDDTFCTNDYTWSSFIQLPQRIPTDIGTCTEDVRARLWSAAVSLRQQGKIDRLEALVNACRAVLNNKYACQVPEVWLDLCAAFG
eukprot:TRINITY_DN12078_c0_g3_i7.p1 TRINITY_DN12078_c0_g3~~TRINITY_DN12078_c0_g3_i7.p1  ORF type:complete len:577 (+),score=92.41 TRINITY_DN12078_c0_g3_i7:159-1889(+)